MSQSPDSPGEAELGPPEPIVRYYRQPGGSLGPIEPLTKLEIEMLLAALGPAVSDDDPRVALLLTTLHWGIVQFVIDVVDRAHGKPGQEREFLNRVVSDPESALATHGGAVMIENALTRHALELSVHRANAASPPEDGLAQSARLTRFVREAAAKLLLIFRGRDARRDYALARFLEVVIYVAQKSGVPTTLPQHSDDRPGVKTTVLFEFAIAALTLATAKGIALAPKDDPAIEAFRRYQQKPTTASSRSAFIKNLEAARRARVGGKG